jgi:hypothetical protein
MSTGRPSDIQKYTLIYIMIDFGVKLSKSKQGDSVDVCCHCNFLIANRAQKKCSLHVKCMLRFNYTNALNRLTYLPLGQTCNIRDKSDLPVRHKKYNVRILPDEHNLFYFYHRIKMMRNKTQTNGKFNILFPSQSCESKEVRYKNNLAPICGGVLL